MPTTKENLMAAFAGESQANRKYLAFAKKAEEEGNVNLAKLFRAVADSETVHAMGHLSAGGEIGSSKENLEGAIQGENYEFEKMYPEFLAQAESEKNDVAKMSFYRALQAEKIHHGLFSTALENISAGNDVSEKAYFVCQVCGHTVEDEAPGACPVCQSPKEKFKLID